MSLIFQDLKIHPENRNLPGYGKDLRSLILFFYTYALESDTIYLVNGEVQCEKGRYRSINDCYEYVKSYSEATFDEVLLEAVNLAKEKILKGFFCCDIDRLNFCIRGVQNFDLHITEDSALYSRYIYKGILIRPQGVQHNNSLGIFTNVMGRISTLTDDQNYIDLA